MDFDFGNFLNNASSLGLQYLDEKYVNKDKNSTEKEKQAQQYERIQQKSEPANATSTLNNQMLIYGGMGLVALVAVALIFKK